MLSRIASASPLLLRSSFAPLANSQRATLLRVCFRSMASSSFEKDKSSLTDAAAYRCSSLHLCLDVDFDRKVLTGHVDLTLHAHQDGVEKLVLDNSQLQIKAVTDAKTGQGLTHSVQEASVFGSAVEVVIPPSMRTKEAQATVRVEYETSPSATALQWLTAEQTAGKRHPYLFTQCQAIHARSMLPCQDTPSVKACYTAEISVPQQLVALMSAVRTDVKEHPTDSSKKIFCFEQKVPIPSYLIALVVGDIESRTIGPRSAVWTEKEVVDKAAFEFSETEQMLSTAESLVGPYIWGRYDLLVLPPSFPYGGMENPCLTFVTPTLLAGDRSLAEVVAHEISHSWTGNLVTNRTWEHFWLNEGFTVFLERKIKGRMFGEQHRQFSFIGGWKGLKSSVERFGENNQLTAMIPNLDGIDPDDAFSHVPYEKGSSFLFYLETFVGREKFEKFFRAYVEKFKGQTLVTNDFKEFLFTFFKEEVAEGAFKDVDWDGWLHQPGLPPVQPHYDTSLVDACSALAKRWAEASTDFSSFNRSDLDNLSAAQRIEFLDQLLLQPTFPLSKIEALQNVYDLSSSGNAEIRFRWLQLAVRAGWEPAFSLAIRFVLEQGRMKFVRPLYFDMFKQQACRQQAIQAFEANKAFYHPIAATMICKDLQASTN